MKTKTKINKQAKRKRNEELKSVILKLKKSKTKLWDEVASLLSYPRRKKISLNLKEINDVTKDGEKVLIAGKVLSSGEINRKIEIIGMNFSQKTIEKLKKLNIKYRKIEEEFEKNPNAEGVKILK